MLRRCAFRLGFHNFPSNARSAVHQTTLCVRPAPRASAVRNGKPPATPCSARNHCRGSRWTRAHANQSSARSNIGARVIQTPGSRTARRSVNRRHRQRLCAPASSRSAQRRRRRPCSSKAIASAICTPISSYAHQVRRARSLLLPLSSQQCRPQPDTICRCRPRPDTKCRCRRIPVPRPAVHRRRTMPRRRPTSTRRRRVWSYRRASSDVRRRSGLHRA